MPLTSRPATSAVAVRAPAAHIAFAPYPDLPRARTAPAPEPSGDFEKERALLAACAAGSLDEVRTIVERRKADPKVAVPRGDEGQLGRDFALSQPGTHSIGKWPSGHPSRAVVRLRWSVRRHAIDYLPTPLHVAAERGDCTLVQYLTTHGADTRARDAKGVTPLAIAAHNGHLEVAAPRLLLWRFTGGASRICAPVESDGRRS